MMMMMEMVPGQAGAREAIGQAFLFIRHRLKAEVMMRLWCAGRRCAGTPATTALQVCKSICIFTPRHVDIG